MNLIEKLLCVDAEAFSGSETADVEIKRLSKIIGEPFIVTVKPIDGERFTEISGKMLKNGKADTSKLYEMQTNIVLAGVVSPDLKDEKLMKHFGCINPKELAKCLFKGGDMARISNKITEISGYGDDSAEELKN